MKRFELTGNGAAVLSWWMVASFGLGVLTQAYFIGVGIGTLIKHFFF